MSILHIRNGRATSPATWCGKKLIGKPERVEGCVETYLSYGSEIAVTFDPDPNAPACATCRERFETAYASAFPTGLEPIATFKLDDPADVERMKGALGADALRHAFGPEGDGLAEVERNLRGEETPPAYTVADLAATLDRELAKR
jgi:hypothetical protein